METLKKLFARARDDIGAFQHAKSLERRLKAMNSIGVIEGYLNAMREVGELDSDTYATQYEEMAKLYSKVDVK
jgi:hypothetical protein